MVFGAAAVASRPAQEDKQHGALFKRDTDVVVGRSAVASSEYSAGNEMQFPSSVNEVVMRRLGGVR